MEHKVTHVIHMSEEEYQITRQLVGLGIETGALSVSKVQHIADQFQLQIISTPPSDAFPPLLSAVIHNLAANFEKEKSKKEKPNG